MPVTGRAELEAAFIAEIVRIVGDAADPESYAAAPDTSDALLAERIARLRQIESAIGHDALIQLVGPRSNE